MKDPITKAGYWTALAAFSFTCLFVAVQLLQLMGSLSFPLDEILIYGSSLCISIPFLLSMVTLHHVTVNGFRFWTHSAVLFTVIYAVFVISNYVVQLATVIPVIGFESYHKYSEEEFVQEELRQIIQSAECPVLLVPEKAVFPENVVVAYDGSASSVAAIKMFSYVLPSMTRLKTTIVSTPKICTVWI